MPLDTTRVALKTAPTGLITYIKHFLYHRKQRKGKPTAELAYHEGLAIVTKFLAFASTHTLGELQHFTANHVPTPTWVSKKVVTVPDENIDQAARHLRIQLEQDPGGLDLVGGRKWWTIRGRPLTGEWIEMRKDKVKRDGKPAERILLYIHGGAYFFSSLETHRYQIQRHARKLGARAFAPSYRLAPQYPFPCGLQDVLASYLYLIDPPPGSPHDPIAPSQIIVSGDSAGAGAVLSLLVILRDRGLPLPAGASLISPWVDLAHSFPSIMEDDSGDYIPSAGFHYRPSLEWPPLPGQGISVELDKGKGEVLLDEQIQMYCPNTLLGHPLVSPVNQGSLGGLPPLLVLGGSSELLRDEIIYVAHKAAAPSKYLPSPATLEAYPSQKGKIEADYPPTNVHLSIYDDTAHVTPTLSITRPAKFMYRTIANFGIWALTAAQKKEERISRLAEKKASRQNSLQTSTSAALSTPNGDASHAPLHHVDLVQANEEEHEVDSDDESEISSVSGDDENVYNGPDFDLVKVTGHEPAFVDHMVRERVSPAGRRREMEPAVDLPGCNVPREEIGKVHAGPVHKWQAKRLEWDTKYAKHLAKWRAVREEDDTRTIQQGGFLNGRLKRAGPDGGAGENPPLCALARWWDEKRALEAGESVDATGKKVNAALAMWAKVSTMPDEEVAGEKKVEEVKHKVEEAKVQVDEQSSITPAPSTSR
ncbi:alpha/beta-hydrolase [Meredithblackwellia eburnea MCA 4105]